MMVETFNAKSTKQMIIMQKKAVITVFIDGLIVAISMLCYAVTSFPVVILAINIGLCIAIMFKARVSFFSIQTLLMNWTIIPLVTQKYFGYSSGLLQISTIPIYLDKINFCVLIYNCTLFLFIFGTNIIKYEDRIFQYKIRISKCVTNILAVFACILILIAYPRAPFTTALPGQRFVSLLPGHAYHLLAVISLVFCLQNVRKSLVVKIANIFVIFWFISHYERVECIGYLTLLILYILKTGKKRINWKKILKIGFVSISIVLLFLYLGEIRRKRVEFSLRNLMFQILVQPTMADIIYVFNTGFEYVRKYCFKGISGLGIYVDKILPFRSDNFGIAQFLRSHYWNAGGGYVLTDFYVSFGYFGVLLYSFVSFYMLYKAMTKETKYRYYAVMMWICMVFRVSWYGLYYYEKVPLIYIPVFMFLVEGITCFLKSKKKDTAIFTGEK